MHWVMCLFTGLAICSISLKPQTVEAQINVDNPAEIKDCKTATEGLPPSNCYTWDGSCRPPQNTPPCNNTLEPCSQLAFCPGLENIPCLEPTGECVPAINSLMCFDCPTACEASTCPGSEMKCYKAGQPANCAPPKGITLPCDQCAAGNITTSVTTGAFVAVNSVTTGTLGSGTFGFTSNTGGVYTTTTGGMNANGVNTGGSQDTTTTTTGGSGSTGSSGPATTSGGSTGDGSGTSGEAATSVNTSGTTTNSTGSTSTTTTTTTGGSGTGGSGPSGYTTGASTTGPTSSSTAGSGTISGSTTSGSTSGSTSGDPTTGSSTGTTSGSSTTGSITGTTSGESSTASTGTTTTGGGGAGSSTTGGDPRSQMFPDDQPLVIFTTREYFRGDLGGLEGATIICRKAAASANLKGTWYPILSSSNWDARNLTGTSTQSAPVYNSGGEIVAPNRHALWFDILKNPPRFDQFGVRTEGGLIYTGIGVNGSRRSVLPIDHCDDWMTTNPNATTTLGSALQSDSTWYNKGPSLCTDMRQLYCIGDSLPPTPNPDITPTFTPISTPTFTPNVPSSTGNGSVTGSSTAGSGVTSTSTGTGTGTGLGSTSGGSTTSGGSSTSSVTDPNGAESATNPITIVLEGLYDNGDQTYTAYFSYANSSQGEIKIPIGISGGTINSFSDSSSIIGQPTVFKPGINRGITRAVIKSGQSLTWTVNLPNAKATSASATTASMKLPRVEPLYDCNNANIAIMGYINPNEFDIYIPVGLNNGFNPGQADRAQPNRFFSGLNRGAFYVAVEEGLAWRLSGKSVTISKATQSCTCPETSNKAVRERVLSLAEDLIAVGYEASTKLERASAIRLKTLDVALKNRSSVLLSRAKDRWAKILFELRSILGKGLPEVTLSCPVAPAGCSTIDDGFIIQQVRDRYYKILMMIRRQATRAGMLESGNKRKYKRLMTRASHCASKAFDSLNSLQRFRTDCSKLPNKSIYTQSLDSPGAGGSN